MMRTNNSLQSFNKTQTAFTLLEVLIAVAITAIVVGSAYIAFGDSASSKLKNKAYQLLGKLQIAQEESIIRGVEFGLRVEGDNYYFMTFDGENWQPIQEDQLLSPVELPEPFATYVQVEGQEALLKNAEDEDGDEEQNSSKETSEDFGQETQAQVSNKEKVSPQIYMLSSGEMNEFTLTIGLERDDGKFYRIMGNYLGQIVISKGPIEGDLEADWDKDIEQQAKEAGFSE